MKKYVSVALAAAMIASMGVTAFAKNDQYKYDVKDVRLASGNELVNDDRDELYFPLKVEGKSIYDDASGVKGNLLDLAAKAEAAAKAAEDLSKEYAKGTSFVSGSATEGVTITDDTTTIDQAVTAFGSCTVEALKTAATKEALTAADQAGDKDGKVDVAEVNAMFTALKSSQDAIKDEQNKKAQALKDQAAADVYAEYDEIEDIDDLKVTLKLTGGSDYVADYYIDEVEELGDAYAVVIELNDNYTTKKQRIKGELTIKNKTKKLGDEKDFSYNHDIIKLVVSEGNAGEVNGVPGGECEFDGEDVYINLVDFNDKYNVADFKKEVENIELEDNNGFYFDVKASDQGKVNLTYDNVAIKSVARVAPVDADLTFFNFYGYPEFDFTGTVTLTPEEDDVEYFVYKVDKDGKISKVNAKLNDDGDAYEFKTRTLACYVLSDMELDVEDINADEDKEPSEAPEAGEGTVAPETGKDNPGTGC